MLVQEEHASNMLEFVAYALMRIQWLVPFELSMDHAHAFASTFQHPDVNLLRYTSLSLWIASLSPHNARVLGECPFFPSRVVAWTSVIVRAILQNANVDLPRDMQTANDVAFPQTVRAALQRSGLPSFHDPPHVHNHVRTVSAGTAR